MSMKNSSSVFDGEKIKNIVAENEKPSSDLQESHKTELCNMEEVLLPMTNKEFLMLGWSERRECINSIHLGHRIE